jgi:hypothetical protein
MSELKPTCCKKVGTWLTNTCGKPSKVVHEGKHYCGIHNPIAIAEKYAVKTAAWHAEWAARDVSRDAAKAKQLEIERRAACYPELLEALKLIAADAPLEYPERYEGDNHGDTAFCASEQTHYNLAYIARAAINKAEGLPS